MNDRPGIWQSWGAMLRSILACVLAYAFIGGLVWALFLAFQ